MRGSPAVRFAALTALALLAVSCGSSRAPRSWLPPPAEVPGSPVGAWIEVAIVDVSQEGAKPTRKRSWAEGEFLAVGAESVHVLTTRGPESIALRRVESARVAVYQSETTEGALVVLGGVLSTASNGVGAVLTAPLWIIVGSLTTGAVSREPLRHVPSKSWQEVSIYARFPQGLPPGFEAAGDRFDPRLRPWSGNGTLTDSPPPWAASVSGVFRVRLVSGERWKVKSIHYSSQEVVHFVGVDGRRRQLRARDVIQILDEKGADVTKLLLSPP